MLEADEEQKVVDSHISQFELTVDELDPETAVKKDIDRLRACLATTLIAVCRLTGLGPTQSLEAVISRLEEAAVGRREAALLLVRSLAFGDLLPLDESHGKVARILLSLVNEAAPDVAKHCKLVEKKQTHEKVNALRGFHAAVCSSFALLQSLPSDLSGINNLKAEISRAFANKLHQGYLQPFKFSLFKSKSEEVCMQIERLVCCHDSNYKSYFDELVVDVAELKELCAQYISFFSRKYVAPFVMSVEQAVLDLKNSASDRFRCSLIPKRRSLRAAEKRYPLHEPNRYVTFSIPMVNEGPGVAVDVEVEIDCGDKNQTVVLDRGYQHLGDVSPGEFSLLVCACILEPVSEIKMTVQVEWRQLFGEASSDLFDVLIEAQDPRIDWAQLEELEPYSLEVAEGEMFVGRAAKVKSIGNKLARRTMVSTYITGQKRIGKTSLSHAVMDYVCRAESPYQYRKIYLEYGEYCTATPGTTVRALGNQIHAILRAHLPAGFVVPEPDFAESLAPINHIARALEAHSPTLRFVVVLDEFDEIHPEMYRMGALAETFFANLRTLAARNNLAFLLVGGEKMPFIIGAQGDQLNKFVREPLDFFDRSAEWSEYCELVTKPVLGILNWDDAALNELFNLTSGHPYYTKLLCAKVLSVAVSERDTEIIASDVRHALNKLVAELDTNSFAHMWKDGINSEREEAEVTELKRLRLLVALGRQLRSNDRSAFSLCKAVASVRLYEQEARPLIDDFVRRDILRENHGELFCSIPLFEKWLVEIGVTQLISSTLGDELEEKIKQAEDVAFVTAGEIQTLVDAWPLYRGQRIGAESVRAWIQQVPNFLEQRLLFKILQNTRFISTAEVEQKLTTAHERFVRPIVGARQIERKTDKRRDVWITYVGGVGKSGTQYARLYAKANSISTECVLEPNTIERRLKSTGQNSEDAPKAIVVVDDVIASGKTMIEGFSVFSEIGPRLISRGIPLLMIAMIATESGERKVVSYLKSTPNLPVKLYSTEYLGTQSYAFPDDSLGPWDNAIQRDEAKSLCVRLGAGLYKNPLGYDGQGLLMVLPDTCPNNCLPILYKARAGASSWRPIFPRQ